MFFKSRKEDKAGRCRRRAGGACPRRAGRCSMTVNGKAVTADVDARTLLVQFLREQLRLTGTHVGCDTSQCGACVVHVDGRAVKSCTVLAASCDGAKVTTIEGLAQDGQLHPMQEAFRQHHGLQCGYCTPGMIMAAVDIVQPQGRQRRRAHDPRGAGRQHLPLYGLPQHRRRGARRRRRHGQRRARPPNSDVASCRAQAGRQRQDDIQGGAQWPQPASARQYGARKTNASSPARASTPTTSTARARPMPCSCAPRTRTPTSSASTPSRR